MTNKAKIALATGIVVLGVGGYFLWKKVIKPKRDAKQDSENQKKLNPVSETQVKQPTHNTSSAGTSSSSLGKTPFTNKTDGNKFRKWVNENYPDYAKTLFGDGLSLTGEYDNKYMRDAWAKYGVQYQDANNENVAVTLKYGTKFQKVANEWNKSIFTSESDATKGVPYISINAGDNIGDKICDLTLFVYDRKKDEPVGGKDGMGYWKINRTGYGQEKTIAWGRWDDDMTTVTVEETKYWDGRSYLDKLGGTTFSGGKEVGRKFGQATTYPYKTNTFKWC